MPTEVNGARVKSCLTVIMPFIVHHLISAESGHWVEGGEEE